MNEINNEIKKTEIAKCTVRIERYSCNRLEKFGTGFFVSKDIICTAKHIIEGIHNILQLSVVKNNEKLKVKRYTISSKYDLAFIQLDISYQSWLLLDVSKDHSDQSSYYLFGFTEKYYHYGEPITLNYTGLHHSEENLPLLSFKNGLVTNGQSGSAIIDLTTGNVVGMMIISKNIKYNIGGRALPAYVILCELFSLFPDDFFYHLSSNNTYLNIINKTSFLENVQKNDFYFSCATLYLKKLGEKLTDWNYISKLIPYTIVKYSEQKNNYLTLAFFVYENLIELKCDLIDILKRKKYDEKNKNIISQINCAIIYLDTGLVPFSNEITLCVNNNIKELNKSLIAGSFCLRQEILFSSGKYKLMLPFEWKSRSEEKKSGNLIGMVYSKIQKNINYTVIADPGIGKSTFSKCIFYKMLYQRKNCKFPLIPIYIDMHNEVFQNLEVGSRDWIIEKLSDFYGEKIKYYCDEDYANIVFVLDALDEFFSLNSKDNIDDLFSSFLMKKAKHLILTCRTSFFDRYFNFRTETSRHNVIEILPWRSESKNKYIFLYLQKYKYFLGCSKINTQSFKEIYNKISNSLFLKEISNIPLWLNMTLEIFSKSIIDEYSLPEIESLVELYSTYTEFWLKNEYNKAHKKYYKILGRFEISLLIDLLSEISWYFYEEILNNNFLFSNFSRENLVEFLFELKDNEKWKIKLIDFNVEDFYLLADFLIYRTLLIKDKGGYLKFIHKSFQEYLVSWYMFKLLTDKKADIKKIADCHEKIISPEVSEFLKGQIQRIDNNFFYNRLIFYNCTRALDLINKKKETNPYSARIGIEQITYNLGIVKVPEVMDFLKEYLKNENDLWIKRGIIIGLSFNGDDGELNKYIERLYEERRKGADCPENNVNIGFSLSFFGDQPFDDYNPDIDQKLPACKHTVERLIYQLSTKIDRPSWRPNLYTLLDLAYNRPLSSDDYWKTIKKLKNEIFSVINIMENDEKASKWPETKRLHNLIINI